MQKKEVLLQAVKRMLSLKGITDRDIVRNLEDVGVSGEDAKTLLREAKGLPEEELSRRKKRQKEREEKENVSEEDEIKEISEDSEKEELPEFEDFREKIVVAKNFKPKKPEVEKVKPVKEKPAEKKEREERLEKVESVDLSKLWEKGILATVEQRLKEMKELKEDIDSELDRKAGEKFEKESEKLVALFESQKKLFVEKAKEEIEEKFASLEETIDEKTSEFKNLSSTINSSISKAEGQKQLSSGLLDAVNDKIAGLEKTSERIVQQNNAMVSEFKERIDSFMEEADSKMRGIDLRITKTLELENEIAEGILKEAEAKAEEIVGQKIQEVVSKYQIKGLDSKTLEPVLLEYKNSINELEKKLVLRDKEVDTLKDSVVDLKKNPVKESSSINPEELLAFKKKIKELNDFKKQFANVVQKSVSQFNSSAKSFNSLRNEMNSVLREKSALIDKKISELEDFEKDFAKEMGVLMEKGSKKKKSKSSKKSEKSSGKRYR